MSKVSDYKVIAAATIAATYNKEGPNPSKEKMQQSFVMALHIVNDGISAYEKELLQTN